MKKLFILQFFFFCGIITAQDIDGSWKLVEKDGQEITNTETVRIYQDGYFAYGTKETETNNFIEAGGGKYTLDKSNYQETLDFTTENPGKVGTTAEFEIEVQGDQVKVWSDEHSQVWQKISDAENDLSGNWVITGRKRNGEMRNSTPGARRTIKILGGDRFQWVAFNSDTKEFHGTGGGTYSAENGKYTENIEFFSRDASRVGASLGFDYKVKDGEWHHSGFSSKGDPMYEIWSPYEEAYQPE
ncbi:hypothetical protein [Salinimicrobium sp. GXAS 041]|uniref:hypothetical protein n=1 Tax=Salinimicrobium sp. GXAS 041 TaxID=3400806 RepID=UPI003C75245B